MFYLHDAVYTALEAQRTTNGFGTVFLFPASFCLNNSQHLSPNWVRKEFRRSIVAAGLDFWYAESTESDPQRTPRKLHKFSTHSLRRTFINQVRAKTGDLLLTQRLARHKDIRNTMIYLETRQEEIDTALVRVFHV